MLNHDQKNLQKMPNITLLSMGQGNPQALKTTLEAFKGVCNEVIFGDLLIFDSDRPKIESYQSDYNLKIIPLPFNEIFINGFASTLNKLSTYSSNDMVIYMNIGEVIDSELKELDPAFDAYCFDHAEDPHKWHRCYNKTKFQWSGPIHEEIRGTGGKSNDPIFRMRDTEKDLPSPFYAKVMNDIKEMTYFNNYMKILDPAQREGCNEGWVKWVQDQRPEMIDRLESKGKRYEAFKTGDKQMYLDDILFNVEFEKERFESQDLINYQGDRMLLK